MNQSATNVSSARAAIVNRTHRIVRQRAQALQAKKKQQRSLWLPIGICSVLMGMVVYAIWAVMDQTDASIADTAQLSSEPGGTAMMLMLWMLPVSVMLLGGLWYRKLRPVDGHEVSR